jgi:uncharacterized membrane protein YfcA
MNPSAPADLATRDLVLRLLLIGAVGGAFSALFGVGGGVVMVPLLIMLCGYGSRAATATSLAAIAVIAAFGVATYGALGNVDWVAAALVGIPALAGVTLGVRVRARISAVAISRAFAVLLVAAAVVLLVGA